jgi:nucleoside-diphosphate-sugar epimerase
VPFSKRLLVLGGTGYLGPAVVNALLTRGHTVTVFHRGFTITDRISGVETLHGDRSGDLRALDGRAWDAVIDTSGRFPLHVSASARKLHSCVREYCYVSSIAVYADFSRSGIEELAETAKLVDGNCDTVDTRTYGPLKALCEEAANAMMPHHVTIARPGLIVGPGDPTDRFAYWLERLQRGGEILAPGTPTDPVQFIDVRDLAEWLVTLVESEVIGTFNAVGPAATLTLGALLDACASVIGASYTLTWVDADFLEGHCVSPWTDMPLWAPTNGELGGLTRISNAKALRHGLTFRPLETTIADTFVWFNGLSEVRRKSLRAGITPQLETKVLRDWHVAQAYST